MAILRSADGKFYEVDDNVLEGKEIKPESLPADMKSGPPPTGGAGGGASSLAGLVQVIINLPPSFGGAPQGDTGAGAGQGEGDDVTGHHRCWHNCWHNHWRNCWRNFCWHNHW
jgi:hypothetical protein